VSMLSRVAAFVAACAVASSCAEATRDFSPAPTLTATTPAATATARPVTTAPSTPAPSTTAPPTPAPATPARTSSPTPAPTVASTPQTTLPPGASLPAMPAQPSLPAGSTQIASGTATFAIAPGETRKFEPADLAASRGASPAPTASLAWTIAWRATESLTASWYRQDSVTQLGRGRWGMAELGGAGFQLRNDSGATVYGELAYLIGSR